MSRVVEYKYRLTFVGSVQVPDSSDLSYEPEEKAKEKALFDVADNASTDDVVLLEEARFEIED